jgi:hypothetical protein
MHGHVIQGAAPCGGSTPYSLLQLMGKGGLANGQPQIFTWKNEHIQYMGDKQEQQQQYYM